MTQQDPPISRRARKPLWRRVLKWTIRTIVVLVVLGIATYAILNYWAARTIRNEIATIRAAGDPLTFAQLDALSPKVDPDQDSGPYYAAALALTRDVEKPWSSQLEQALTSGKADPAFFAEAQKRLDENQLALEMLDRGSKLSQCGYDLELKYGIAVALPRLSKWRTLARAASLRTRLLAYKGKGDQAVESAISELRMLRVFDHPPVLVAYLVKVGCAALFSDDITTILDHGHPSAQSLEKLEKELSKLDQSFDLAGMFRAERVYYLEISRSALGSSRGWPSAFVVDIDKNSSAPPLPGAPPAGLSSRIIVAKSLPIYRQFIAAASSGWPEAIDATKALADKPSSDLARIIAPSFARSVSTTARLVATVRSTIVALQIERYRLANGHLPDSLDELPGAQNLPHDPFTGNALIYRKSADGFSVYGLQDGRDAGGKNLNTRGPNWGIRVQIPTTQSTK